MNTTHIDTAHDLVTRFGLGAHGAIDFYRTGAVRIAQAVGQRWDTAFREAAPQLSAETKRNAKHAKHVFGAYYQKGVALSADGATVAVDTVVGATLAALDRASTYAARRAA